VDRLTQRSAAFGSLTRFDFQNGGSLRVRSFCPREKMLHELEENRLKCFMGFSGHKEGVLRGERPGSECDVAASGGGLLHAHTSSPTGLRRTMIAEGLGGLRSTFDHDDSTVQARR
jgi:hypothetical protein